MNLEIKDELYYIDLIADLKEKAGIEEVTDTTQADRIGKRREMIPMYEAGKLFYKSSQYSIEFAQIARDIYIRATGEDGLAWLEQLRDFPEEVNKMIKELENKSPGKQQGTVLARKRTPITPTKDS